MANQSLVGASPLPTRHTFHRSPPSHLHTEQNHLHPHPRLDPRISIIIPSSHLIFFQSYFYLCLSSRFPFSSFKESFHHVEILLFPDTNHVKRKKKMSKNIFDIFYTFHIFIIFFPYTNTLKKNKDSLWKSFIFCFSTVSPFGQLLFMSSLEKTQWKRKAHWVFYPFLYYCVINTIFYLYFLHCPTSETN